MVAGGRWKIALGAALLAGIGAPALAADPVVMPGIRPLEERAKVEDRWLKERLDTLVPMLMRRDKVAMWILIAGEYNEDPVAETMLPGSWLSARRRTVLIFHDRGGDQGVERLAVARYPVGDFKASWDPEAQPDQWAAIAEIVKARNPASIALNSSEEFPLADGLTASHRDALTRTLGADYASRFVSHQRMALDWLGMRVPAEVTTYPTLQRITHAIIAEAMSDRVITPGVTTTNDVVWWFRERVAELKLDTWFHPSVSIQRQGIGTFSIQNISLGNQEIIQPGDLLHLDFGISYLGLKTDVQRMAYVLRPGESDAPKGLRDGIAAMGVAQAAVQAELKAGRTGNEVLRAVRARTERAGVDATIYTHPIGYHGHGAGPWIGAWEDQSGVPGRGDAVVSPNTAWSIELSATTKVPEWGGQPVRFMYEEDGFYDGKGFRYFDGWQERMMLVGRP
ncbi:M24 family metallopeptidase [Sphingomonas baiyangensis]|uniref:Aminopeptidase P family protein n=1 Tax=Sphingomonas baiyangensis TaxID=2572576 RepID=A0A4V5PW17_9SPHN|nr:M24 family metallopeptidase [Sphingomonas baiyangensis]TKD49978.1 aminopeptidase P family protein [Sphingomonas baiyangensis]